MPPGLLGLPPEPGSLNGEPGLFAELPGVVSPRSWQDWFGGPGGPGGLSARAGLASPSEKKAMIRATTTDLRMTLLLLSGDAPAEERGRLGRGIHFPLTSRKLAQFGSASGGSSRSEHSGLATLRGVRTACSGLVFRAGPSASLISRRSAVRPCPDHRF